jgi:alpha-galactosidase
MPSPDAKRKYFKETGRLPESADDLAALATEAWPERRVFQVILDKFGLLPITSDSHFGEYIQWAYDITDHRGILDFYRFYKGFLAHVQPTIELRLRERIIPIIEGIVTDSGYLEEAVNIPNDGLIDDLPEWLVVEVPATVDRNGVHGCRLGKLPRGFAGLLMNQVAVHDLTAEAIINRSKTSALQALLVDPVVGQYCGVEDLLDTMLGYQEKWLGYLE